MAHELEILANGEASMAYVGETPWHGLGVRLPEDVSPSQMQKAAGLDWTVEKRPDYFKLKSGEFKETGKYSLIRTSDERFLTTVGEGWNPVQNSEAFEFFDEFCRAGKMSMHTAGSLFNGRQVWALAKVASDFELFNGDKVEGFLLFSNPHQFGKAIDVRFTPIRVVCNNTLTLSLDKASNNMVRINHASKFNPEMVKDALGLASEQMQEYKEAAEVLGKHQMSDRSFKEFLNKVLSSNEKIDTDKLSPKARKVYDLLETQPGAEYARGSWWQGFNALTYWMDHQQGRSADARLNNVWFGGGRKTKIDALKTALEMATA